MANTSIDELFIPMHDSTILVVRKHSGTRRALLVLPDHGHTIDDPLYARISTACANGETAVYVLELRGHGKSEGKWSPHDHARDIKRMLDLLSKTYKAVYVLACGLSATHMLEHENAAHAMLLIDPKPQANYRLQTPTIIFSTSRMQPGLITGPVLIRHWPTEHSRVVEEQRMHMLLAALRELYQRERPMRFSKKL
jgi:hypothetical protein